jgi:hypothetical protein
MDLQAEKTQALRMAGEMLAEMAWKKVLSQDGGLLGKGVMGEVQSDWLAQNLAKDMGAKLVPDKEGSHGA